MSPQDYQPPRKISKVRQACDCCHARKIRCDGTNPCVNCLSTELNCTYLAIPKKKGPKGRRIRKDDLRKSINQPFTLPDVVVSQVKSLPAREAQTPEIPIPEPVPLPEMQLFDDPDLLGLPDFQPSLLVTTEVMFACLDAFFTHKYPITPILDKEDLFAVLPRIDLYPEQYGLITACCAMVVLSPDIISLSRPDADLALPSSEFLMSETIRARQYCNHIETPTLATVHTSFFLFAALFCLGKDNSAWFYIREAMTVLQLLRLHEESTYTELTSPSFSTYARRTFWLLFVTERAYALQRHRPLTLQRTIALPTVEPDNEESTILSGFLDLVSLLQNFDDEFLALWNLSSAGSPASATSLIKLQGILDSALPNVTQRTENQQADLLISRQWLKTMVWQLCVSKGLLSSQSTEESMSFHFPVTIARDVVIISHQLPPKAFEANGVGILEKVFDVGCSLADVLLLNRSGSLGPVAMEFGARDYLVELVGMLGTVLGGSSRYLQLLAAKADECLKSSVRGSLSSSGDEESRIYEIEDGDIVDFVVPEEVDVNVVDLEVEVVEEIERQEATPRSNPIEGFYQGYSGIDVSMAFRHPILKGAFSDVENARVVFGPAAPAHSSGRFDFSGYQVSPEIQFMDDAVLIDDLSSGVYEISTPEFNSISDADSLDLWQGRDGTIV